MDFSRKKKFFFLTVLFTGTFFSTLLFLFFQKNQSPVFPPSPKNSISFWQERVARVGPENTYKEFKTDYSNKTFPEQHTTAHLIGEVLYTALGLEGFSVCDASFAFGCYHSFMGQAIASHTTAIVPLLAQQCKDLYGKNSSGCEHGIGHGILEYLGPSHLLEALALCKTTEQRDPLSGCTSGIFMEYNSGTVFENGTAHITNREPDIKNHHAPCNSIVPAEFRPSCYHEISLWWKNTLKATYQEIGVFCSSSQEAFERESCYRGWGAVVAEEAEYNPEFAEEICNVMNEKEGVLGC